MRCGSIIRRSLEKNGRPIGPYGIVTKVGKRVSYVKFNSCNYGSLAINDHCEEIKKNTIRPNRKLYEEIYRKCEIKYYNFYTLLYLLLPYEDQYVQLIKDKPEIIHIYYQHKDHSKRDIYIVVDDVEQVLHSELTKELKVTKKPYIRVWVKYVLNFNQATW